MKKISFLFLLCFFSISLLAQNHLRITNITGLPIDTAYEIGMIPAINITISNDSGPVLMDTVDVFIKANSLSADTLYPGTSADSIITGDSITHVRNNYIFSPVFFDDGDNIVVVWPMARMTPVIVDTLTYNVYFISIAASIEENNNELLILYPNPTTQYISFRIPDELKIKQVRIHTLSGKEVYRSTSMPKFISIADWPQGMYIIEIENTDGKSQVFKLQKN